MNKIALFEYAKENRMTCSEAGINSTAYWAYERSKEAENELIDFNEVIWDEDVAEIAETFMQNYIDEFTISSTYSSLIETLAAFEKCGFKIAGLTEVNATYTDFTTGKRKKIPAIRMQREYGPLI